LSSVNVSDFDAIFYVGGHGPVIDLAYDETSIKLIADVSSAASAWWGCASLRNV
jgi:putative intracellular protease/amidase